MRIFPTIDSPECRPNNTIHWAQIGLKKRKKQRNNDQPQNYAIQFIDNYGKTSNRDNEIWLHIGIYVFAVYQQIRKKSIEYYD